MPLPQAELDAQHVVILAKQLLLRDAIITTDAPTILAARKVLAAEVAKLPLILLQDQHYAPPTEAAKLHDVIYESAYGLAPAF